jgi:hypothetical protein
LKTLRLVPAETQNDEDDEDEKGYDGNEKGGGGDGGGVYGRDEMKSAS